MAWENQLIEALADNDGDRILAIQRLNRKEYACQPGGWDKRMEDEFTALFGSESGHRRY